MRSTTANTYCAPPPTCPPEVFDPTQLLVGLGHLGGGQVGGGAQYVFAVVLLILFDPRLVDRGCPWGYLQESPVTPVTDEFFHPARGQLHLQLLQNRLTILAIFHGPLRVHAHHVAPRAHPHLLHPYVVLYLAIPPGALEHLLA